MKYSIVEISGKQYRVEAGDKVVVDRIRAKEGETIELDKVLLKVDGDKVAVGTPEVKGEVIKAKVLGEEKAKKVRVATYKAKSRYRKVKGHRQKLTRLEILPAGTKTTKKAAAKSK